jgi:hypothetical protein
VKTQAKRDKAKEMFWRKTLTRFFESGLSQSAFCKLEHLNPNSLSSWKIALQKRDAERAIQPPQSTFVSVMTPVNNLNLKVESPALVAEIDLDARTVRIFKSADSETLRALLAILREPIK